jgi:flagellar hook-length control protein FliK
MAPLRAALAAMAAGDTPAVAQPAANAPVRDARHVAAPAATPLTAPPALADAGPVMPRRDLATPAPSATPHVVALAASRGDAGSSARDGADAQPNFGGPAVPPVALPRIDAATPVAGADPVAGAASAPVTAPVTAPVPAAAATPELGLGRVELSSAARFEQTLAALDPDTRNLQAMVRTVRLFSAADGASEARLQLDPEHLGPVALTVRVEQGTVSAHFRAETPAAQRWIETHQQELRAGLREQGLEVRDLVVTTDPDGRRDRRQDAPPARPARPRRNAANEADLPRFEVLV